MKKTTLKSAIVSATLICAIGLPSVSSAYDTTGTLGTAISNIDVYHTSCFTWTAAAAARQIPAQSALPTGRFVARVAKKCTSNNVACGAQAGTLRVSIGPEDSVANDGTTLRGATATATASTGGVLRGNITWAATPSAWVQTANNGVVDKNGGYVVIVGHETAVANNYWMEFYCQYPAVNALPAPSDLPYATLTGTGVMATGEEIASPYDGYPPGEWNMLVNQ